MEKSRVIVVTGAAGTIGSALCRHLARIGHIPIVTDIDEAAAAALAEELLKSGFQASAARLDITDRTEIDALVDDLSARWGRIDAVVNNAYPRSPNFGTTMEEVSYDDFCRHLALHLGGYFLVSQRLGIHFRRQGHGNIVNITSIYGVFAPDFSLYDGVNMTLPVEYASAKAGIVSLTRYFASHYKKDGVRCNAVAPGGIRAHQPTAFVERYDSRSGQRGMLEPEDVTGAAAFLLSDASVHMTGQVLVVDDGWSL